MNYKNFTILFFVILISCTSNNVDKNINIDNKIYSNKGFALIFSEELINNKKIKKKIDPRSLDINHNYLPKGTKVKITNLLNNKSIVANVTRKINNIDFYKFNFVIAHHGSVCIFSQSCKGKVHSSQFSFLIVL